MTSAFHGFDTAQDLAESLADAIVGALSKAIATRGSASLAVSGGSTPKRFFQTLSTRDMDWSKVTITLVDERFVPPDNDRSNHLLVAQNLLQNKAAAAHFASLYQAVASVEEAARLASEKTRQIGNPFDAVILGMGSDGHTASFFPGGSNLAKALDAGTPRGVITMEAEGAGEPRLTFTFASLQDARLLILHIEGDSKKQVLEKAQADGPESEMPIRAILRRAASLVEIYWAP
ncbi:6-phosphogluconolactonase [Oryzifoliimicrobium ureilyticus]|uniref:6-phosphogluconolactonase n=1 Tax=Oryzifoliimicrobium ureilyticus TaxID=3113724 RepID=UPI00307642BC